MHPRMSSSDIIDGRSCAAELLRTMLNERIEELKVGTCEKWPRQMALKILRGKQYQLHYCQLLQSYMIHLHIFEA